MRGDRSSRWSSPRLRLGVVAGFLLAACGLTLLIQSQSNAETPPVTAQMAAFFPADNKLLLAVTLSNPQKQELAGPLQVELLAGDKVLAHAEQAKLQKEEQAGYRFELAADKAKADGLTVRARLGRQKFETPLSKALLIKGHETSLVLGQEFFAGSAAPFRCDVHGVRSATETLPLAAADVEVRLTDKDGKAHTLYSGKTDGAGRIDGQIQVPALPSGQYTLAVTTRSALGEEKLQQAVRVKDEAKVMLISDKPVYQPGQLMQLRALVLRPFDLRPVEKADMLLEIEDGKGNKVFKQTLKTNAFGVAAADFQLADEVNTGDYHLRATLNGRQAADKTVQVKRYQLPKFKTDVSADKKFYMPKETVHGSLQADYFFGKPVAAAKVEVKASTFDVQFKEFQVWKGQTDASGHVKFEIQLPAYFVGQPLQKGDAVVKLEVKLTDTADHTETITRSYPVSEQPIRVSLIPEGGKLVPNMENRVFAAAVYPDGSPAACEVKLWAGKEAKGEPLATVKTNDTGLAEVKLTPKAELFRAGQNQQRNIEMLGGNQVGWGPQVLFDVTAQAKDAKGTTAKAAVELNSQPFGENVLLRLNKAIYQGTDSLEADIRTSAGLPTVYLDIVRNGQIVLSRWLEVKDGKASHKLDLPQELFGSLEVHAYQMLRSGEIIRDSRVVYVQPRNDLKVTVKADKSVYAPGANGRIRFQVTDAQGRPTQAALGVIVVDEAVYALQELQPGLEKVYFTLQEELLKPQTQVLKVGIHEDVGGLVRQPRLAAPQQQVAQVLLTAVKVQPPARWQVAPALQRKNQFEAQVQQVGWGLFRYAWFNEAALQHNDKTGRWDFSPNLLQTVTTQGFVAPQSLNVPFTSAKLTLEELARTEKGFGSEELAQAITRARLERLAAALVQHTDKNRAKLFKDDKWALAGMTLVDAARANGLDDHYLRDGWGQAFKLVHRTATAAQKTGHTQFDAYDLLSAGPDRDFQTGDDVRWTAASQQTASTWWAQQVAALAVSPETNPYGGANPYANYFGLLGTGADVRNTNGAFQGRGGALRDELRREAFDGNHALKRQNLGRDMDRAMPMQQRAAGLGGMPAAPGAMPMAAKGADAKFATAGRGEGKGAGQQEGQAAPAARVRDYFPETLLWQPSLITDENGVADMAINLADSITTWRLSASASSKAGALGGAQAGIKVFQDFFVDIDLPLTLTQNDEVAFPVAVYNYLKTPQTVKLELQQEAWFDLADGNGLTRTLELQPNEVTNAKFRIRAKRIGNQPLTVKARGTKLSDAVRRVVEVVPDGQKVEKVVNDRLAGKVTQVVEIPADALPDSSKLMVRVYPGVMAQVMDGMEGMLRMPGGCFEQTSSSAYPNVLVVDYIKKARLSSPELLMKCEQHLNVGYQRLLTFERPGGGFDWWGHGEPLVWLSAYGLQEFSDMAKVYPVDRGIIERTQQFLMKKRDKDGTWSNIGATHAETIASIGNPKLVLTSYVAWSLLDSGLPKDQLKPSIDYIRANVKDAGNNAYVLALAANALAAYDAKDDSTLEVIRKLEQQRQDLPEMKAAVFPTRGQSINYARGDFANVETTALTVLAMHRTGQFTNSVNKALTYLIKSRQGGGHWGSTSATILALKALLAGMGGPQLKGRVDLNILVNGKQAARSEITEENADVVQFFDLKAFTQPGANQVELQVGGETPLMYQIVGRYFEPWKKDVPTVKSGFEINVAYDRTKLAAKDLLKAKATVKYHGPGIANMVMVDLGIAPGFTVDPGDFAEMVGKKASGVQKFSVTSRQVILYLTDLRPGEERTFEYALRARFPVRAQAPAAVAYEYYTPTNRATSRPVQLTVVDRE